MVGEEVAIILNKSREKGIRIPAKKPSTNEPIENLEVPDLIFIRLCLFV